jgi:hypothetical protein
VFFICSNFSGFCALAFIKPRIAVNVNAPFLNFSAKPSSNNSSSLTPLMSSGLPSVFSKLGPTSPPL